MKKLRPEKGSDVTKINSPPNTEPYFCPSCRGAQMPLPRSLRGNQGRPPCPQRVQWHIKCHLHNAHKPALPHAAQGKREPEAPSVRAAHTHTQFAFYFRPLDSATGFLHGEQVPSDLKHRAVDAAVSVGRTTIHPVSAGFSEACGCMGLCGGLRRGVWKDGMPRLEARGRDIMKCWGFS